MLQVDLLHPFTSIEWVCCSDGLPSNHNGLECVVLRNKVYVKFEQARTKRANLFVASTSDLTFWEKSISALPTRHSALTTYHSQLVLVGGIETSTGLVSNKLWTSDTGHEWQSSLPPMPTPRCNVSVVNTINPECLVVAGVFLTKQTAVEMLIDKHWATIEIPLGLTSLFGSTLHNGKLYLNYSQTMYYCDVELLVSCTQPVRTNQSGPLWSEILTKVPGQLASLGKQLIALGEIGIKAYSLVSQSWTYVSSLPVPGTVVHGLVVLPTGNLLVFTMGKVYQAALKGELEFIHAYCK